MSVKLHPFPSFLHPPFGSVLSRLPVTRHGVRLVPDDALVAHQYSGFAELRIHAKGALSFSRGICGLLPAESFLDGTVRPHERTLTDRLESQEKMVLADNGALGKPVLLTSPSLKSWWAEVDGNHRGGTECLTFYGQNNNYHLRVFDRSDNKSDGYKSACSPLDLRQLGPLVIADGHHRAATHARLSDRGISACDYIPVCIIGGDELTIGAFARVITAGDALEDLLPQLAEFFDYEMLEGRVAPQNEGEWLLVHNDANYRLTRRASSDKNLDSAWLDHTVLPAVFGITDTRTDARIAFAPVPNPEAGILNFATSPDTVYLYGFPLSIADFFAEVEAGRCLPPKSTMFEPRVPSGLVVWRP